MNLFFLVEGRRTEPKVYDAWVKHTFPHLRRVYDVAAIDCDCYCIFSGNGYPQYRTRLETALLEARDYGSIDHFFLCVDSEGMDYENRVIEERRAMQEAAEKTSVRQKKPRLELHVVVQHCCIETWFLGHRKMLRRTPMSARLAEMKRFYDVSEADPELMGKPEGYLTRASYHLEYLKEMLREHDKSYSKDHPGVVCARDYLDALRERCVMSGHLASLSFLLSTWQGLAGTVIAK